MNETATRVREKPRTKTDIIVERQTNKIWGYVRENAQTLCSETSCKVISKGIYCAVDSICTLLRESNSEKDGLRAEVIRLKKLVRELVEIDKDK